VAWRLNGTYNKKWRKVMLKLKKAAVAVLALGSSVAFAGTMGPVCAPGNVTVPCETTAWDFGARALYIQPTYSGALSYLGDNNTVPPNRVYTELDPNWGWGFEVEGSYHFNTGNDFNINWYHYSKTSTQDYFSSTDLIGVLAGDRLSVSNKPRWDAVNLEFGQHVDFGDMKSIRFHGGGQFARVKTTLNGNQVTLLASNALSFNYSGFGPRAGVDMNYGFGNGLNIYAKGAGAVLAGTSKFTRQDYNAVGALVTNFSGSKRAIVPELEGKLGIDYTYAMASGDLTADVGYMWQNYFSAQQYSSNGASDFGVQGLYFGLKWIGNVA